MSEPGIVVVGAGLAAANVVISLREEGYTGPLTLVGDEGELPYERPPLSKEVLQGKSESDSVYVKDAGWYDEHHVDLRLDDRVVAVDALNSTVRLASGEPITYRDLVLATGARPRMLELDGIGLDGVHTLRRIEDSNALRAAFGPDRNVVIIGAGWIGLEVAAAARTAGATVTVLEYADVPLQRVLGDEIGGYFADLHRRNGVDLRTGVGVDAIEGEGSVTGVRVGDEVVPADLVVVGVGAVPNTELAEQAGLAVDNGIVVDAQLRTGVPHVLAIGDVANAHNEALDARIRVEHWDNAIRQGQLAAKVLLGGDERYDWQPYFFTDQFDLGMEYVGHGSADDEVVVRGELEKGEFIVFWLSAGTVSAAMNVNVWDVNDDLRALIGRTIDPRRLADEGVELTALGE